MFAYICWNIVFHSLVRNYHGMILKCKQIMVNCDLVHRISKMSIIDDDADNSNRIVMLNVILSWREDVMKRRMTSGNVVATNYVKQCIKIY